MKNAEVAKIFNEMADILEIQGENPFRVRAYRRAAMSIDGYPGDVAAIGKDGLKKIPGIGDDLASKVMEIVETGTCEHYETLKSKVPEGLTLLLGIPGLGPKTARLLHDRLKVKSVEELESLAKAHRLKGLPGIQEKTEKNILKGIETLKARKGAGRSPIGKVLPLAEEIMARLKDKAPVTEISLAGSLRRWRETIRDIDILASSGNPVAVMDVFASLPEIKRVLAKGGTKTSVLLAGDIQSDLRVVEEGAFGAALCYFTGSKEHNIRLREMAVKKGLKVNEYGVFEADGKKIGGGREEDVYKALGLPFIPPELREDSGEIEAALAGRLPRLVELADIKGDLHVHSKWSDGSYSFDELAQAALERGYRYIAITDHSKGLGIARGLTGERIMEEVKAISALNKKLKGLRLLSGVEVDIRADGSLDLPDEILSRLDVVNAAIHSGFRQSKSQLTRRLTGAMKNPYVGIISHPTGRLLGEREAYEVDMDELLEAAKKTGTALEINAFPARLDLNDVAAKRAKQMGIPIAISTDAHLLEHFGYMAYGVSIARRAWLEAGDILNTRGLDGLLSALRVKRKAAS